MEILLIDNYDSFTYNIVQILEEDCGQKVDVVMNDEITVQEMDKYEKIVISPGPGLPKESGIILDAVQYYASKKSILGVCLGHQAIGEVFGCTLQNLKKCYHGVSASVSFSKECPLFDKVENPFEAGRYHSWVIEKNTFPNDVLDIIAWDDEGSIMAIKHKTYNTWGIQFHPESILTPKGKVILKNWTLL